ncbi:hypothetical protein [Actinosynnema sp. NPDC023587]|uniref:hypothetical protein n=1 Tax=Actinosynnema sp. NPDC023587 TaxID=3154695 RepID=UPI0033D8EEBB
MPEHDRRSARARFEHEFAAVRTAFAAGRLGLVDVVLISIPPLEVLRRHRDGDRSHGDFLDALVAAIPKPPH